ncbi:cupin domain-containing protein [Actinoplanes sp. NPDC049599]|uniref:cupin domain-containing protein n=1 Tax=Actinoplanes sp. NPDC049599 TaxID=3363903 RepID=UPI00379FADD9
MTVKPHFPPLLKQIPLDEEWVVNPGWAIEARRLKADGCDVVFATYPEGMSLEPHQHDDMNIVGVVTQGCVRLTIDGVEGKYGPGDWFHVPTSVVHSAYYESECSQVELVYPPDTV